MCPLDDVPRPLPACTNAQVISNPSCIESVKSVIMETTTIVVCESI